MRRKKIQVVLNNNENWEHRWARWASILATVVTVAALYFGVKTYTQTADAQSYALAVSLLQDYLRLAVEQPLLAKQAESPDCNYPIDEGYEWFASHAILTAESIYNLENDDKSWRETIASIVEDHRCYIFSPEFPCKEYDPEFIQFVEAQLNSKICE